MPMDRYTLYMIQATILIFFGISVLLSRRTYRLESADSSAAWFAAGYLIGGIGLGLQSMRDHGLPPLVGILLSNFLFMLLMPCVYRAFGIATHQSTRRGFRLLVALNVVTIATFAYFTYVRPNLFERTLQAGAVLVIMVATNVVILLRSRDHVIRPATRMMAWLLVFQGCSSVLSTLVVARKHAEWFSVAGLIPICGLAVSFMCIDALRLSHGLEQRAMIDPLTAIFNRRALDQVAERLLQRSARARQPCSALMLDIDQFKQINDSMGHLTGDITLCAVAATFSACLRKYDIAIRLGGDEFFILLPDADGHAAAVVANRVRAAIQQLELRSVGGQPFHVSCSIGTCTLNGASLTIDQMLHSSDISLYREKQLRYKAGSGVTQSGTGGAQVQPSSS
jgi:diguanylate cyclase (GGDEF)-like protein